MFSRPFRLERADRLADACGLLRDGGEDAKVIAGGQSLLPMVNLGLIQPEVVVDISRAADGRDVSVADGYLTVGALVTHARLAADPVVRAAQPMLSAAAGQIGNARARNRGTLGGSLAHSDAAAELPLVMTALGATYAIIGADSSRIARAEDFHVGYFSTDLATDELVVSAQVPALGPGWGWSFQEISRRHGDFAIAAVAALVRIAGDMIVEARVAVGAVSDRPVRLADIETVLTGAAPDQLADRVGPVRGIRPVTDASATAEHRTRLARVLVLRALAEAARRSQLAAA